MSKIKMFLLALAAVFATCTAQCQIYPLTGACNGGICFTSTPTQTIDVYITSNDASGVPYQLGIYAGGGGPLLETLPVAADGTFPGGSLTNVGITVVVHKKGRFETRQVTLTATVNFDSPSAPVVVPQASVQTGTSYTASSGYVSSSNTATMDFYGGGNATVDVNLSSYCTYGNPCNFQGRDVRYNLPDGSSATLTNLTGSFDGSSTITGTASGVDSNGNAVSVDVTFSFYVVPSHSGRGGGTSKVFLGGSLTVTVNSASAGPGMPAPLPPQKCPECCDIKTDDCCNSSGCSGSWEV